MTTACWHCSNPAPAGAFPAQTPDGPRDACCPGCAAAIETIYGLGLDDYYQMRQDAAPQPDDQRQALDCALFSVPELIAPHLTSLADGQRLKLQLGGLTCAACSWLIEKTVSQQPGVLRSSVNLASMTLSVDYNGHAEAGQIAQRIQALGYTVTLPGDPRAQADEQRAHKQLLGRLALAGLGAMQAMMYSAALYIGVFDGKDALYEWVFRLASFAVATPVVFYSGWPFFQGAWRGLKQARLTMDAPIALALLLAWAGSLVMMATGGRHVYFDSAAMFVFFLLASRWLEQRQRMTIQQAYRRVSDTLPQAVRRLDGQQTAHWISARQVAKGDRLQLIQGDIIPVDGILIEGRGAFDESALNGEPLPVNRGINDPVHAGSRLVEGNIVLEASGPASSSLVAKIAEQVEHAQHERVEVVRDWQRIAPLFTGGILLLAAMTFIWHWPAGAALAFEHTLAVLVVTCPCALALAVPLTLSSTLGTALREGILVASPRQLLRITSVKGVLFDKTGTLTAGQFRIVDTKAVNSTAPEQDLLAIAAALEWNNPHPLAKPFQQYFRHPGVTALHADHTGVTGMLLGNTWRITGAPDQARPGTTCLQLLYDNEIRLYVWLQDPIRTEASAVVKALSGLGITSRLASGDNAQAVNAVADQLDIRERRYQQKPAEKAAWLKQLESTAPQMMVGDGINDAQAMVAASVSVATGNATSLAQRAAGLFLLHDTLNAVPALPRLSRLCQRTIRQNLAWALLYNILAVPFAVSGLLPPWAAALGMSASSLLVTFNATRVTRWKLSSC
ncbi:MAG: heavy metal translocating P-type ATPase [Alloalcanivorax sp.]